MIEPRAHLKRINRLLDRYYHRLLLPIALPPPPPLPRIDRFSLFYRGEIDFARIKSIGDLEIPPLKICGAIVRN